MHQSDRRVTVIESIATGNPPVHGSQQYASSFMQRVEGFSDSLRNRLPQIYERSGIDYRYSCVEDYKCVPEDFNFFPKNWSLAPAPSTATRNSKYRQSVIPLAERVAHEALEQSPFKPSDITHIITVSCTGFFAPGIDIELVKRLGLSPSTQRTMIGFMGCYAAFNALRVANAYCKSEPDARVLIVCAELCTLHFQIEDSLESAVINAIFSDGAAAVVVASRPDEEAHGGLAYVGGHCLLDEDSMDDMTWDIGDQGFLMGLSARVPKIISQKSPVFLNSILNRFGMKQSDITFWAIHPGGRSILDKVAETLCLRPEDVFDSLEVLRLHGNMSSPTILFVLKRFLDQIHSGKRLGSGVALAFGPGLTVEGALFKIIGS